MKSIKIPSDITELIEGRPLAGFLQPLPNKVRIDITHAYTGFESRLEWYIRHYGKERGIELYSREKLRLDACIAEKNIKHAIATEKLNTISNSLWGYSE